MTILIAVPLSSTPVPILPLLLLVGVTSVTNVFYGWWLSRFQEDVNAEISSSRDIVLTRVAFALMAVDLVMLTAMLFLSGGVDNPFSFFFFVNLAVGGVMLDLKAAWALAGLAVMGYGVLLVTSRPVPGLTTQTTDTVTFALGTADPVAVPIREIGLLVAFATCASVVTYFVNKTSAQLRQRERDLRESQAQRAESTRLEALTTLAAGAAHELATPLSTIAIVCRELTHHLEKCDKPDSVNDDLGLIEGQLEHCRQILARMRSASGDLAANQWNQTTLGDLIDATLEGIRDPHRVDVVSPVASRCGAAPGDVVERDEPVDPRYKPGDAPEESDLEGLPLWLPEEAVAQAIRNLIHNGLDASASESVVTLESRVVGDRVHFRIRDSGAGMSDEVMRRAGDPFFTTKTPDRGMGLGLFLTRNVITRLGGQLEFQSQPGSGTTALVDLPIRMLESLPTNAKPER
ncbi:MAG: ATP-binding protein [Planctomycetota bacterium]